jgi:hypothetical protein
MAVVLAVVVSVAVKKVRVSHVGDGGAEGSGWWSVCGSEICLCEVVVLNSGGGSGSGDCGVVGEG